MAISSRCYTDEDAKSLPGGVFECEFSATEETAEEPTADEDDSEENGWNRHHHHHRRSACCPVPLILLLATVAHFHFLKRFEKAQRDFISAGGKLNEESRAATITAEDEVYPEVVAPVNYTIQRDNNNMA
jgi:hypothetical protein